MNTEAIATPVAEAPTPDYWGNFVRALYAMAICRLAAQVETVARWLGHHSWLGTVYEDRAIEVRSDGYSRKVFLKTPSFNNARTEVFNVDVRGSGDRASVAMHRVRPGGWMTYIEHIGNDAGAIRDLFQANVKAEEDSAFAPVNDAALFGHPFAELKVVEAEPVNRETSPEFQLAQLIRRIVRGDDNEE